MPTPSKEKSLYQRAKESKPRFYPGKVLTRPDVKEIEELYKQLFRLRGAVRDLTEK